MSAIRHNERSRRDSDRIAESDRDFNKAPAVPGGSIMLGDLVRPAEFANTTQLIEMHPDPAERLRFVTWCLRLPALPQPAVMSDAEYQAYLRMRTTLRMTAYGRALQRIVDGVSQDGRPVLYARVERREARRILDAMTGMLFGAKAVA